MTLFSKATFVFFSFLIAGSAQASIENSKEILLVGSGGWKSCKYGVHNQYIALQFHNLVKNLKTTFPDKKVSYIVSCADGLASAYGERPLKYYTSEMNPGTYSEIAQNRFYSLVAKKMTADTAVYLVGHSHGGWYSMKVVEALKYPVAGLFTLEPISASGCDTITYMHNRDKKVRTWAEQPMRACRQAPSDTRNQLIADKIEGSWLNYHLPSNQYRGDLYSGPIATATNIEKRINVPERPHHAMGMHAEAWNEICHEISSQLGASADAKCPTPIADMNGQFIRWSKDLN